MSLQSIPLTYRQILEMRQNPGLIPTIHKDVFTLTSPVCIVRDYVILSVCKISLSFSPFSPSRSRSLSASQLKERRFYPPADLWYTPFRRLHASYITRLKQSCCNERYLGGMRPTEKQFTTHNSRQKYKVISKPYIHFIITHKAMRSFCVQITLPDGDNIA